jgi:endonuclease YncB( thermonuclease family)
MKPIACIVLLLLTVLPGAALAQSTGRSSVINGGTVEIGGQRFRLFGIDAPKEGQTCSRNGKAWQCGRQAALALAGLLGRRWISCVQHDRDRDRHIVAICYLDKLDVNGWMVRQGWALDDLQYSKGRYAAEEAEARTWRRGIWAGDFERPSDWRQAKRVAMPLNQSESRASPNN